MFIARLHSSLTFKVVRTHFISSTDMRKCACVCVCLEEFNSIPQAPSGQLILQHSHVEVREGNCVRECVCYGMLFPSKDQFELEGMFKWRGKQ